MKLKIALCLAASVFMSADLFIASANAQGTPVTPGADSSPAATTPQSSPDIGDRSGKWKRMDGQGGGRMRERMMEKFDTNHDGTLDDGERAAMRAAREQRKQQRGMAGGGKRGGLDGAGAGLSGGDAGATAGAALQGQGMGRGRGMNDEQRQARKQKRLERFDTNHDGQLDAAEKSKMREQIGNRAGGKHHRRGMGGGGAEGAPAPDATGGGLPPATPSN